MMIAENHTPHPTSAAVLNTQINPVDHIRTQLEYLFDPGNVFEVTAFNFTKNKHPLWNNEWISGKTITGYFDDLSKAVDIIHQLNNEILPESVTVSLNPVKADFLGRANNRLKANIRRTSDKDVLVRKNILIDIDPVKISGVSATDDQVKDAEKVAAKILQKTDEMNLPKPLQAHSGNGVHLIYKVDLENTQNNNKLIETFTEALAEVFNNDHVKIDTSVTNPSRLVKAYGTYARKGDSTLKQPHRLATIDSIPYGPQIISRIFLEQLDANYTAKNTIDDKPVRNNTSTFPRLDLPAYLSHYNVTVIKTEQHGDATLHCLDTCIFDPSHRPNKASIGINKNGTLFYQCFHKSCTTHTWEEVRQIISGDDKLYPFLIDFDGQYEPIIGSQLSGIDILNLELPPVSALIENMIGQEEGTTICGPAGVGKSVLTLNIAMALGSAQISKLWGLEIQSEVKTLFFQSENGVRATQNRLRLICNDRFLSSGAKNIIFPSLGTGDIRVFNGNFIDPVFIDLLLHHIELSGAQLVIIDPLISFHYGEENGNSEMRRSLDKLSEVISKKKCSFLIIHHVGRIYSGKRTSYAGRGASAAGDWADNNFLLEKVYPSKFNPTPSLRLTCQKSRNTKEPDAIDLVMDNNLVLHRLQSSNKSKSQSNAIIVQQALEQLGGKANKQTDLVEQIAHLTGKSAGACRSILLDAVDNGHVICEDDPKNQKTKIYSIP